MDIIFTLDHRTLIQFGFFIMLTVSFIQLSQYITAHSRQIVKFMLLGDFIYTLFFLSVAIDIAYKSVSMPSVVAILDLGAVILWAMSFNASIGKAQPKKMYIATLLVNAVATFYIHRFTGNFIIIRGLTTILIAITMSDVLLTIIKSPIMKSLNSYRNTVVTLSIFILLKLTLVFSRLLMLNDFNFLDINLSMTFFTFFSLALAIWFNFTITYIDLEVTNIKLKKISLIDHLTELPNRRAIESKLEYFLQLHIREKLNFYVILLDVDDFKKVNDTYGHDIGDEVLKELSSILINSVRAIDRVGRYGGEEFILVIIDEEKDKFCERLTTSISTHQFSKRKIHITVSGGLTAVNSDTISLELKDIISKADKNLYKAKNSGKNKILW